MNTLKNITRIDSLDIFRGIAILMMGQYHFMRWFINEKSLPDWLHLIIYVPGKLSAPFFLIISGIGAVMLYENYKKKGKSDFEIFMTTLKRGIFLIVLTIPLNIASSIIFKSGAIWEWNIFQLVGVSMLATVVIGRFKIAFVSIFFIAVWVIWKVISSESFFSIGIVPLIPWVNYYLVGCMIGIMLIFFNKAQRRFNYLMTLGLVLFIIEVVYFGFNINVLLFSVGHNQRLELISMAVISLLFFGIFSVIEIMSKNILGSSTWLRNIGYVPLSIYYMHILFKYSIVVILGFMASNMNSWSVIHWVFLNIAFWPVTFVFVNQIWAKKGFKFGVEWFMSKYVSPRSMIA